MVWRGIHEAAIATETRRTTLICSMLLLFLCITQTAVAGDQSASNPSVRSLMTAEQVVQNMVRMNLKRAQALQTYESTRVYKLQYRGFPGGRDAQMVVLVRYMAPRSKEFVIQSTTGSKLMIDRVLKKLLDSEREALEPENQASTALTPANYIFTMLEYVAGADAERAMYFLSVEPKVSSKFLYRGKIWVDAEDFAVARIEAEPAKSPSFWTKRTVIEHRYMKVEDFWLPANNHSVSEIRLGGHADLEIEYGNYQLTAAHPAHPTPTVALSGR